MVNLPQSCNIAFKEWSGVCDALIDGRQTVILRKGGISERGGPGHFAPEHSEFWLYPTWTHQSEHGLRSWDKPEPQRARSAPNPDGSIPIRGLVLIELAGFLTSETDLPALREFHCLDDETIWKRFHYRVPGLWVLGARVFRRDAAFSVMPVPQQAGCTSWVLLDDPLPTCGLEPVVDESDWAKRCDRLRPIICPRAPIEESHDSP
jgi:hypothetical protein